MQPIKHALVLTGEIQAGFDAVNVWPALAAYFRMEPDRLKAELLARAPISIKESDDLAKLQRLQEGANATGAVTELQAMGDGDNLFVLVDGVPRGPVPHAFVDDRVRSGVWLPSISVAVVGSSDWKPFIVPTSPATEMDQQATVAFSTLRAESMPAAPANTTKPAAAPELRMSVASPAAARPATAASAPGELLPEGDIVHAGFWRRCAAYMLDSIILSLVMLVVVGLVGVAAAALVAGNHPGIAGLLFFLVYVLLIVGMWLYFAKFESGPSQATPGKRVMGIKVTDDKGQRIGFGRATGRFFGKIISGMIMNIGYMMAGFTGRKQALHDLMAGCCVVFKDVEPGRPMPAARPKMPWYGWVLNFLPLISFLLVMVFWSFFFAMLTNGMNLGKMGQGMPDVSIPSDSGLSFPDSSDSSVTSSSSSNDGAGSSGIDANEQATVRAGLTAVYMIASETQAEVAAIADAGGDCPTEDRNSTNNWIESIQLGGISPACTVTIRLSSSSDIPFAARIERIEWTYSGGNWRCESSMASDLLPFTCN
jgi:uncharacterized RDD family membrane protein YckC